MRDTDHFRFHLSKFIASKSGLRVVLYPTSTPLLGCLLKGHWPLGGMDRIETGSVALAMSHRICNHASLPYLAAN